MKTMTCRQMGGPCDLAFHGNTADEVIKAQDAHLKDMTAKGDEAHKTAAEEMQGRWKNPIKGMGWYMKTKKAFAALPKSNTNKNLRMSGNFWWQGRGESNPR